MEWSVLLHPEVLSQVLVVATPVILAAQGEILIERSGILNLSIEGMTALGAAVGFLVAYHSRLSWLGILAAMAVVALFGLALAYGTITLQAPQIILGLALLIFTEGLASLLYRIVIGVQLVPPRITTLFGGDGFWVLSLPAPVYIVLGTAIFLHHFLFYTKWGLWVRACGENPRAADLQGINVFSVRYVSTICGAAVVGAAGALIPLMLTGTYSDGMVGGRGWIALMLVIFGRWRPLMAVLGGWLFGYAEVMQFQIGLVVKHIPSQFLLMLPYLFVILVSILAYRGAAPPRALLKAYDREQRT